MNLILLIFLTIIILFGIYFFYNNYQNNKLDTDNKKINVSLKKNIFDSEESLKSFESNILTEELTEKDEVLNEISDEEFIENDNSISSSFFNKKSSENNSQDSFKSNSLNEDEEEEEEESNQESLSGW